MGNFNTLTFQEYLKDSSAQSLGKFGEFLLYHAHEIETILKNNVWGMMNHCPHRICGIIERMWGFYLVSLNMPLKQLNMVHDWDSYNHEHMKMNGTGVATL